VKDLFLSSTAQAHKQEPADENRRHRYRHDNPHCCSHENECLLQQGPARCKEKGGEFTKTRKAAPNPAGL
jgi:hypothetical protein